MNVSREKKMLQILPHFRTPDPECDIITYSVALLFKTITFPSHGNTNSISVKMTQSVERFGKCIN